MYNTDSYIKSELVYRQQRIRDEWAPIRRRTRRRKSDPAQTSR